MKKRKASTKFGSPFEQIVPRPKHRPSTSKPMANKFLPFIVEKSTPLHIYRTLLSRSKAMNYQLITSIFTIILAKGIGPLREFVKSTPDLPMAELYERIHNHYHDCRAPAEVLALVAGMSSFIDIHTAETWPEEFQEFTAQEALLYFYVLSSLEIPEFPLLWDVAGAVESRKEVFNNLKKFTHFSDSGAKKFINNFEQIPSLILCNYLKRIALPDADPKGWCISVKETGATSKESGYGTEETSRNER